MKTVTLAHGSGGQAMQQLINQLFIQAFDNPLLNEQEDQARIPLHLLTQQGDRLAFSTDSYVIDPLFFPGGDIGKLAVCGTSNDVAVSGAFPRWLSCSFILEEGLTIATLERIVDSMAATAKAAGLSIVTGDTKVVPRGAADKVFINTAGIGMILPFELGYASDPSWRSVTDNGFARRSWCNYSQPTRATWDGRRFTKRLRHANPANRNIA